MKIVYYTTLFAFLGITNKMPAQAGNVYASVHRADNVHSMNITKSKPFGPVLLDSSLLVKSAKEKKGDKHYFVYSFDKAIENYSDSKDLTVEGQRKLAKSYYYLNQNTQSEAAYEKLITMTGGNTATDYYNYAMVLKYNGKHAKSAEWMDKFVALRPEELRSIDYLNNKTKLPELSADKGKYKIRSLDINSDAQDFGTAFYKNKIVFASSRTIKSMPKTSNRNGKPYLNIYVSDINKEQLSTPENFDKSMNGKMNEGPASFSRDGNFMAFTKNNYNLTKKELIVNVEIYFRTFTDGKWTEPIAFSHNNKNYSTAQPALSANGKTMYFTCNMPGGYGGADIYKVTKGSNNQWGIPVNLGSNINTEGDEVFPFFLEAKGLLYFSSNGRFGLGGLDIFSAVVNGEKNEIAYNAGYPLNSNADDFSIALDSSLVKGYFSSNRAGGKGDDDIYALELLNGKIINGKAKDNDENLLAAAFITLLDEKGVIIDTVTTNSTGAYSFNVETEKNYKLTGTKEKYTNGSNVANTSGPEYTIIADITLNIKPEKTEPVVVKKDNIKVVKPKAGSDLAKVMAFKPIYFDYGKSNIRADAAEELDKIIKIMNDNPDMVVKLNAHTDCRSGEGFNQLLSKQRAISSVNYIKKSITNPSRITGKGYGESKLINKCACNGTEVSDCSEADHQQNRRTEFIIIKN